MISVIAAIAYNGIIGNDNSLLWHIREDLQRFKQITTGHPVVMGRKTFESIGKPLPNRKNVVVTRDPAFAADGVAVVYSLEEAFLLFEPTEEIFVIGGGEIYRQAMPLADRLYLTEVGHDYPGDVRFPAWDTGEWRLVSEERHERGEVFPYPFVFKNYERLNFDPCD